MCLPRHSECAIISSAPLFPKRRENEQGDLGDRKTKRRNSWKDNLSGRVSREERQKEKMEEEYRTHRGGSLFS